MNQQAKKRVFISLVILTTFSSFLIGNAIWQNKGDITENGEGQEAGKILLRMRRRLRPLPRGLLAQSEISSSIPHGVRESSRIPFFDEGGNLTDTLSAGGVDE